MENYICEMLYALYAQDWIDENTTPEMRLQNIREYYDYCKECVDNEEDVETYKDYLDEFGFNGSIYVCYEEFCDEEFYDVEFVRHLLKDDKALMDLYFAERGDD